MNSKVRIVELIFELIQELKNGRGNRLYDEGFKITPSIESHLVSTRSTQNTSLRTILDS